MKTKILIILFLLLSCALAANAQYASYPSLKHSHGRLIAPDGHKLSSEEAVYLLGYMQGSTYHYAKRYYDVGKYMMIGGAAAIIGGFVLDKASDFSWTSYDKQNGTSEVYDSLNGVLYQAGYTMKYAGAFSYLFGQAIFLINRYKVLSLSRSYNASVLSFTADEYGVGLAFSF